MDALNYQNMYYFWIASLEGSITKGSERLHLAASTVSTQVRALEEQIGRPLFNRRGRHLTLTEEGRLVQQYAADIFGLGTEMLDVVREGRDPRHVRRLRVGVADEVPKVLAYRLLAPIATQANPVHLIVRQDRPERLVADLAVHELDAVVSDARVQLASDVRANCRRWGSSRVSIMASPELGARLRSGFPGSMDGAPILVGEPPAPLRRAFEAWVESAGVHPRVVAEIADSALLKSFGRHGAGAFPVPSVVRDEVAAQYGVVTVAELADVWVHYYVTTLPGGENGSVLQLLLRELEQFDSVPSNT